MKLNFKYIEEIRKQNRYTQRTWSCMIGLKYDSYIGYVNRGIVPRMADKAIFRFRDILKCHADIDLNKLFLEDEGKN